LPEDILNKELKNSYKILGDLGEGTFGSVKLARLNLSSKLVAIKILEKSRVKNEADL
jgi:serine/threonine protein kinase